MTREMSEPGLKDKDGKYLPSAWPGMYPIVYYFADGEACCHDCANGKNGSEASTDNDDPQWKLIGFDVVQESPAEDIKCGHCGRVIVDAEPTGEPDPPELGESDEDPLWDVGDDSGEEDPY